MPQSKRKVLVVDDDYRIRRMVKDYLGSCGFSVLEAVDGESALDIFFENNSGIDIILLDVMMPGIDGLEVLREIRNFSDVPIILLSAKSEEYDQLQGFKKGADDYIAKPFSPKIMLAHIEAVLKRCIVDSKEYRVGNIIVEDEKRLVHVCGEIVEFTPKEYDLLLYFIQNVDIALSRENILNSVWNYDYAGDLRTVDTHIKQLRAKLTSKCAYIKTVHGFGYRFEVL